MLREPPGQDWSTYTCRSFLVKVDRHGSGGRERRRTGSEAALCVTA